MPKNNESLSKELYDLLVSKDYSVEMLTSAGKSVPVPKEATVFKFKFERGGEDYGTINVTIDGLQQLTVYYNQAITRSGSSSKGDGSDSSWIALVKQLKNFARSHQLGFRLRDIDRLDNDMKQRDHEENSALNEGYYGNKHTSYSDSTPPTVKMIIKHTRALEETDARFRNIDRIFLENSDGERVLVPSKRPGIARVFARHLAEGGLYRDERWQHIAQLSEDVGKLGGFVRATRNGQFNEGAVRTIAEATEQYQNLRETLKRMSGARGYNQYFENWQQQLNEEGDVTLLSSAFTNSSIDPRIEGALPTLARYSITLNEISESNQFESWAASILDEALQPVTRKQEEQLIELLGRDSDDLPLGPYGDNAIGELRGIIESDTLNALLERAAEIDSDNDARPIIMSWLQTNGDGRYQRVIDAIDNESHDEKDKAEEPVQPPKPKKQPQPQPQATGLPPPPPPPMEEGVEFHESVLGAIKRLSGIK
jgi:hypothetical protein